MQTHSSTHLQTQTQAPGRTTVTGCLPVSRLHVSVPLTAFSCFVHGVIYGFGLLSHYEREIKESGKSLSFCWEHCLYRPKLKRLILKTTDIMHCLLVRMWVMGKRVCLVCFIAVVLSLVNGSACRVHVSLHRCPCSFISNRLLSEKLTSLQND